MFKLHYDWPAMHSTALLTGGWILVVAGIVSLPLPAPSSPAITLGGLLLARHSRFFRCMVAAMRSRFPETSLSLTNRSRTWLRPLRYIILRTDPRRVFAGQRPYARALGCALA